MSMLSYSQQDGREFKQQTLPPDVERPRRTRKPIYSRTMARTNLLSAFPRRRTKRFL